MNRVVEKAKAWLATVGAETSDFCKLCTTALRLSIKAVKKQDVSAEKPAMHELRAKTKNAQIAFGVIAALLVLFLFMWGCGSTTNGAMDVAETVSIPEDAMRSTKPMAGDIHQTAQEIYNHRARNVIRELPFIRVRPKEGEVWQHDLPSITVIQVVDGGVLAITDRSSFDAGAQPAVIHVATRRSYADGDKLAIGFYRCMGRYSYTTTSGAKKTVYSFEDLPSSLQQEIAAISIKERQAEFEENMRRQKEEKEAEEEARKHPKTPDAWIKNVFRIKSINDYERVIMKLIKTSYTYRIFLEAGKNRLDAIKKKYDECPADEYHKFYEEVVRAFADWVFKEKINSPNALLDKFMPTIQFANNERLKSMQSQKDWIGLLNVAGFGKIKEIDDDAICWRVYDDAMKRLSEKGR